jgi:hypothetical protein
MKILHLSIMISVISVLVIIGIIVSITSNLGITIKTDWPSYSGGSVITVSGKVEPIQSQEKVLIQVFYPNGKLYNSSKIPLIENSNLYSYQFTVYPMNQGTYNFVIHATYAGKTASTVFEFIETRYPPSMIN